MTTYAAPSTAPSPDAPLLAAHAPAVLAARMLDVIEHDVVPLTEAGVARGCKVFGAAILLKRDLSLVLAETNNEVENPLWHGEMHALKRLHELPSPPAPADCLFVSTHEPCSLCLSAITWAGFDRFAYLFSHQDSRDRFAIPHDIRILREVFRVPGTPDDAPLYNRENAFWRSASIPDMVDALPEDEAAPLRARIAGLTERYAELSAAYQGGKGGAGIPLP